LETLRAAHESWNKRNFAGVIDNAAEKLTYTDHALLYCFLFSGFSSVGTQQPECVVPYYGVAVGPTTPQAVRIQVEPEAIFIAKEMGLDMAGMAISPISFQTMKRVGRKRLKREKRAISLLSHLHGRRGESKSDPCLLR